MPLTLLNPVSLAVDQNIPQYYPHQNTKILCHRHLVPKHVIHFMYSVLDYHLQFCILKVHLFPSRMTARDQHPIFNTDHLLSLLSRGLFNADFVTLLVV